MAHHLRHLTYHLLGFGHETVLAALAHGDKVIATARNPDDVNDLADKGAPIIALDLSWPEEKIQAAVQVAIQAFRHH